MPDVKVEAERVERIATELGGVVVDVVRTSSFIREFDYPTHTEYVVIIQSGRRVGVVRVADCNPDTPIPHRTAEYLVEDPVATVLLAGDHHDQPPAFMAIHTIGAWIGVAADRADAVYNLFVTRHASSRRGVASRARHQNTIVKLIAEQGARALAERPADANDIIVDMRNQSPRMASSHARELLETTLFVALTEHTGTAEALALPLPRYVHLRLIDVVLSEMAREIAAGAVGEAPTFEARRQMIWNRLRPVPLHVRTKQGVVFMKLNNRLLGIDDIEDDDDEQADNPYAASDTVLIPVGRRVEFAALVLLDAQQWLYDARDRSPWMLVSEAQDRLAVRERDEGSQSIDQVDHIVEPYPTQAELFGDLRTEYRDDAALRIRIDRLDAAP